MNESSPEPLVISADDLGVLKSSSIESSQLTAQLGQLEYQRRMIDSEMEALMPKFAVARRNFEHHFNRIRTKYGLSESAKIDEKTGEVN